MKQINKLKDIILDDKKGKFEVGDIVYQRGMPKEYLWRVMEIEEGSALIESLIDPAVSEWFDVADLTKVKRYALIKTITRGKKKGQFYFSLIGDNYENVGNSLPETYKAKAKARQTLKRYHPSFRIQDETK